MLVRCISKGQRTTYRTWLSVSPEVQLRPSGLMAGAVTAELDSAVFTVILHNLCSTNNMSDT